MKKINAFRLLTALVIGLFFFGTTEGFSQVCAPSYTVNFTGNPTGTIVIPGVSRSTCSSCDTLGNFSNENCVVFDVTLDPQTAGLQVDGDGAMSALTYNIDCSTEGKGGKTRCLSGTAPKEIKFCKNGGNLNTMTFISVSKPLFPADQTVRVG